MLYLDTSLLVDSLTNEAESQGIQEWLGGRDPNNVVVSDWVVAEFPQLFRSSWRRGESRLITVQTR
jgi:hypothetical protein